MSLKSLLPKHEEQKLKSLDLAFAQLIRGLFTELVDKQVRDSVEINNGNNKYLNQFARMFGIAYWDSGWPSDRKVKMLRKMRLLNKYVGTRSAVQAIVDIFVDNTSIKEWFSADDLELAELKRGSGYIHIPSDTLIDDDPDDEVDENVLLRKLIDIYKPVHFTYSLRTQVTAGAELNIAAIGHRKRYICLSGETMQPRIDKSLAFLAPFIARRFLLIEAQ